MRFSVSIPRRVSRILILIFSPFQCALIYLIFQYAFIPQSQGLEFVISTVGVMFSAGQILLFLDLLPDSLHQRTTYKWAQFPLLLLIIVGFAICLFWIGFGPGMREFTTEVGGIEVPLSPRLEEILGRAVFTIAGLAISRVAIRYAIHRPRMLLGLEPDMVENEEIEE